MFTFVDCFGEVCNAPWLKDIVIVMLRSGATPRSAKPLVKAATSIETPQLASGEDAQVLLTADSHAEDGAEEQQSREEHTLTQSGKASPPVLVIAGGSQIDASDCWVVIILNAPLWFDLGVG